MVRFVQGGIPCRCGQPDVKCGIHYLALVCAPKRKPKRGRK